MIRLLLALLLYATSLGAQQLIPDTLRGRPGDTLVVRVVLPPAGTYQLRFVRPAGTILGRAYVFATAPPVVTAPGAITTLKVTGASTTSLTVAWTVPTDGAGHPANVALRWAAGTIVWGNVATEVALPGTAVGATQTFQIPSLTSGRSYQVQAISYRGTLNVDAVFGPLSNIATGTTGTVILPPPPPPPTATILLQEPFEDNAFASRGWYDNTAILTTTAQHAPGSTRALELHWTPGATMPTSGGSSRHLFPATTTLDVHYWVKYSSNWVGSGKPYHPHEFLVLSDQDGDWDGPSNNWLTAYIEHVYQSGGVPRFAIQDNKAINTSLGALPLNLLSVTETRSVAGCNGVVETNVITTCFNMPPWYNDKEFHAAAPVLPAQWRDTWNQVEAYLQLNTVVGGIGVPDGVMQYWFNGTLVIDRHDVLFRTGARPTIQFHQFLIGPYIGDGSPVDQTMWVDNLTVATSRVTDTTVVVLPPPPPPSTGTWPNEPAGWTTMTDFAFDNYTSGGWHTNPGPTIIADPTAPVSPPNVAQWFYPQGFGAGSSPGTVYFPATMKDHYVGYSFKYSNPYSNQVVGTKQWYPASTTGSNYFMLFASDSKLWMYVQADGAHGSSYNLSSNVSNPTITLGVWHKLEILQRYPSSSTATDGVFRWWIDGVLCGNYPTVTWNVNSVYDEVRFVPVWGGIGGSVGFNSFWWVDHVHLSRP